MTTQRLLMFFLLFFSVLLGGCTKSSVDISIRSSPIPVNQFVRQTFWHGPLLDQMRVYSKDPKNVQRLSDLLNEQNCGKGPGDGPVCSNVVTTLGAIGGPKARNALTDFLRSGKTYDFRDKTDTVKAIALSTNRGGGNKDQTLRALRKFVSNPKTGNATLKNGLTKLSNKKEYSHSKKDPKRKDLKPKDSERKDLIQKDPKQEDLLIILTQLTSEPTELRDLRRSAVIGLVFAGDLDDLRLFDDGFLAFFGNFIEKYISPIVSIDRDSKIRNTLEHLISQSTNDPSFRAFVTHALRAHERVVQVGLECYFEEGRQEMRQEVRQELSEKCKARLTHKKNRGVNL